MLRFWVLIANLAFLSVLQPAGGISLPEKHQRIQEQAALVHGTQHTKPDRTHDISNLKGNITFDRPLAETLLNFSRITYCDHERITNWNCTTCGHMGPVRMYYNSAETGRHVGVYVAYWTEKNQIIVAFRGTDYLINWIQDLEYVKADFDYKQCNEQTRTDGRGKRKCRVHSGFYDDWKSVRGPVMNATKRARADFPNAQIFVTGHSLGGALAAFAAVEMSLGFADKNVTVYTFGEPRLGNQDFAEFYNTVLPQAIRVVHQDDVVPHLPPYGRSLFLLTDFHHHATEIWQTGTKDDTFVVCDWSGEVLPESLAYSQSRSRSQSNFTYRSLQRFRWPHHMPFWWSQHTKTAGSQLHVPALFQPFSPSLLSPSTPEPGSQVF